MKPLMIAGAVGLAAIGYMLMTGKGEEIGLGGGGLGLGEKEEALTKKETVTETYAPTAITPPTVEAPKGFFDVPTIIHNIIRPTPTATKYKQFKRTITGTAGTAVGYKGYVTPTTPTPISPGYVPGVTTFKPYVASAYVPSPHAGGRGTVSRASGSKKRATARNVRRRARMRGK